jgi:hypothetical protein
MKVELHSHTNHSDGLPSVENLMKKAQACVDAIAITDHNTFSSYLKAKRMRKNIMLIPGIEVTASYNGKSGHVIVLGTEELGFKKFMDALELVDNAHSAGAVAIVAHPFGSIFRPGFTDAELVKRFDAVEVINGMTFGPFNRKAMQLAKSLDMKMIAGSDAHTLGIVGRYACEIKANDVDDVIKAIKKGRLTLPDAKTEPVRIFATQVIRKVYTKLRLHKQK